MYLTYDEYRGMGGILEETAFISLERKAAYFINSQSGGKTGERIGKLTELPQAVKDCTFDLVEYLDKNKNGNIASESQSLGGRSQSVSYKTKSYDETESEKTEIVERYFYGGGLGNLLYRGL